MSKEAEICDVIDTDPLYHRIMKAYFRKYGKNAMQPHSDIPIVKYKNKYYAVLYNGEDNILAVYRVIYITPDDYTLKSINVEWFKKITKKLWE
jgi:hypothetical protein